MLLIFAPSVIIKPPGPITCGGCYVTSAQPETKHMPKLRVGFILAPRFTLAAFANFVDAVRLAADDGDRRQQIECEWEVLGEPGEMIESSCGRSEEHTSEFHSL